MKLSIIYANYNTTQLLLNSLASLNKLPKSISYEVIVVDDGSNDFDATQVTDHFPQVKVVQNPENLGFGRTNNSGAELARGDYLWILNTDTLVPEDNHIDHLIEFLDGNPIYAAALPLLTDLDGHIQPAQTAYFPSPFRLLANIPVRLLAKLLPFGRALYGKVLLDYLPIVTRDVDVAVAAALIVRRQAFIEVGGFSPEFFMFYEDSDLCRKLHDNRYKIRFFTQAHTVHLWGQSITGSNAFTRRKQLYFSSQDIYLKKWHSQAALWAVRALRWPLVLKYHLLNR
jgi:GT2 family glycosyltransferase